MVLNINENLNQWKAVTNVSEANGVTLLEAVMEREANGVTLLEAVMEREANGVTLLEGGNGARSAELRAGLNC